MYFEALAHTPGWATYYRGHGQRPHYQYLRTVLKALQFQRGGQRWLLKSPQHLEQFPVLADVFPDATIIVTHRDPVAVTVSMATMAIYLARLHADPIDPVALGPAWADRIEALLSACLRDRDVLPPERTMDLRFVDFMADEFGVATQIHELAGEPLTARGREAIGEYLDTHRRGRLGRIDYRAEDLGLDVDELTERFAPYSKRFL
jgi:Sulfotransferase family